jgi:hypothetical protein
MRLSGPHADASRPRLAQPLHRCAAVAHDRVRSSAQSKHQETRHDQGECDVSQYTRRPIQP